MSTSIIARHEFRFSGNGAHAACFAVDRTDARYAEQWTLTATGPQLVVRTRVSSETDSAAVLVTDDGRLLHTWLRQGRQHMAVLPHGDASLLPAGTRMVGAPPGHGAALAMVAGSGGHTRIYQVCDDLAMIGPVAGTQALLGRAVLVGDRLVFSAHQDGDVEAVVLDVGRGELSPLRLPERGRVVPLAAAAGTVLLGMDTAGGHRIGLAPLDDPGALEVFAGPAGIQGTVLPMALAPTGDEVLLRVRRGVRSTLLRYHPVTGATRRVDVPAGTAFPAAAWPPHGVWLPHATPTVPTTLWWQPPHQPDLRCAGSGAGSWAPASTVTLPGAAGDVEAIAYGSDWRTADRVVLALHGGPSEHWELGFDYRLQRLVAAGVSVVAPNQRGSTGYGHDHEYAIKGAWGGPDLDDILAIGRHMRSARGTGRPQPGLYGTSYGAYLGLLASACAPELWSGCVAVSPFLSGARLYPDAGPRVRARVARLDGATELYDDTGPRDLLRLAPRVRGRVLLVHGDDDPVIPVSHARALAAALQDQPGVRLTYREVPRRGHDVLGSGTDPLVTEIASMLAGNAGRSDASDRARGPREPDLDGRTGRPDVPRLPSALTVPSKTGRGERRWTSNGTRTGSAGAAAGGGRPHRWRWR